MSGDEKAGSKRPASGPVIDVDDPDNPDNPRYVSTFGERVRRLVETFTSKVRYFTKDGKDFENVEYNGVLLERPFEHNACKRVLDFQDFENKPKQEDTLRRIITVYNAPELEDKFADAKEDVLKLLTMMAADRPIQRAVRAAQEQKAAVALEKQRNKSQGKQLQPEAAGAAAGKVSKVPVSQLLSTADRLVYGFGQNLRNFQTDCMHDDCVAAHVMTIARALEMSEKHGDRCQQVYTLLAIAGRSNCLSAIVHVAKALFCPLLEALLLLQVADFDVKQVLREASESKQLGGAAGSAAGGAADSKKRKGPQ